MSAGRLHDPTEHQLSQARRGGDVPRSRVMPLAAVALALCMLVVSHGQRLVGAGLHVFDLSLSAVREGQRPLSLLSELADVAVSAVLPVLGWLLVAALLGAIVQPGGAFVARREGRRPTATSRLGAHGRLLRAGLTALFALSLLAVLTLVCLAALRGVLSVPMGDLAFGLRTAGTVIEHLLRWAAGALVVLAVLDMLAQRALHRRGLRMTDAELLEEQRRTQLDPALASERRRMQRRTPTASDALLARDADLIVVSRAGHLVAITHRDAGGSPAHPRVVVSIRGLAAQRLLQAASSGDVASVLDDGLAEALARSEPGQVVPRHLFASVAAHLRKSSAA